MCVLNGLQTRRYDQIVIWWSSNPQSGIDTVLDSGAYFYIRIPCLPCYSSPRLSYHTRSFARPDVSCIRPSISTYRTRSFAHPGVSCLHPSILSSLSASPPSSGSTCMTLSTCSIFLFASRKTLSKVSKSCFSVASWCHQASLLSPPPS